MPSHNLLAPAPSALSLPKDSVPASSQAEAGKAIPAAIDLTSYRDASVLVALFNSLPADSTEKAACNKILQNVLSRAREYSANINAETLKSILPLTELYSAEVIAILANALDNDKLKTNRWIYIGLSSVLQMALVEPEGS